MTAPIGPGDYVQSTEDCHICPKGSVWLVLKVVTCAFTGPCAVGDTGKHTCPPESFILSGMRPLSFACPACFSPFSGPEQTRVRVCEEVGV